MYILNVLVQMSVLVCLETAFLTVPLLISLLLFPAVTDPPTGTPDYTQQSAQSYEEPVLHLMMQALMIIYLK